ncbi:MAG TPA: MotA/TolQ/ExbB proton channel family protein, partial [Chthoniobacteraceae bacterium]
MKASPLKSPKVTFLGLMAVGLLCAFATLHADEPGAKPQVVEKTLLQQIVDGGWVMWPIGLCSILTLYFIGDGVIRTKKSKVLPDLHVNNVKNLFRQGNYTGAFQYCKANPSPFTNVCRVAVSQLGEGKVAVEEGMIAELAKENARMQTQISYLSVIGVCAPMIGLLGTVTGMIRAFKVLGANGIGDPSQLSQAIGEVLVATASGLFIAIPAFGAFYFLRNRAGKAIHDIQDTMATLFRKMPYDLFAGVEIGDDER